MKKQLLHTEYGKSTSGHEYSIEFWGGETAEVNLISYPTDALGTLVRTTRGYAGNYTMEPITVTQQRDMLAAIPKTALTTQMEMLNFVFLIRDVPRSLTHQMVRTRVGASYVQESTRFMGARNVYKVQVPRTLHGDGHNTGIVNANYIIGVRDSLEAYEELVSQKKVASQDARLLFPHGMLTSLFVSYTLKTFAHVYNQRFCCAAETNWYSLMRQMKALIRENCGDEIADMITAPIERGENCGYNSSLDRECTWKKRTP